MPAIMPDEDIGLAFDMHGCPNRCLHVSDNDRSSSQHLPPGQGTIDWKDLLRALVRQRLSLPAVIEVPGLAGARATVEYLRAVDVGV